MEMVSTCSTRCAYLHDILDLGHVGPAVVGEYYSRHVGGIVAIQGHLGTRKKEQNKNDAEAAGHMQPKMKMVPVQLIMVPHTASRAPTHTGVFSRDYDGTAVGGLQQTASLPASSS